MLEAGKTVWVLLSPSPLCVCVCVCVCVMYVYQPWLFAAGKTSTRSEKGELSLSAGLRADLGERMDGSQRGTVPAIKTCKARAMATRQL